MPPASKTQRGYLVLADISGYTSFVAATELEHSQEILSELLELIIQRLAPPLTLSKLEGDAVFVYGPEAHFTRGEAVLELIEATYVAFRDRVEGIRRRTTCQCNACKSIPALDLKILVHHGSYVAQSVMGIHELAGSDVNLIHRLLKNKVTEATGWRAYALFTEPSLTRMGLEPALLGLHAQTESYEHLGAVQTYSLDLRARYQEISEARRVFITPAEADLVLTQDFSAPPPVVWDWMNDPLKRNLWGMGARWTVLARPSGRTGAGTRNHCAHGKSESVETVLDWRPFDYVTAETREGPFTLLETIQLEPLPEGGGTRLSSHLKAPMRLPRQVCRAVMKLIMLKMNKYDQVLANAADLLARRLAEQSANEQAVEQAAA